MPSRLTLHCCGFNEFSQISGLQSKNVDDWTSACSVEENDKNACPSLDKFITFPLPVIHILEKASVRNAVVSWSCIAIALEKENQHLSIVSGYLIGENKKLKTLNGKAVCATESEIFFQSSRKSDVSNTNFEVLCDVDSMKTLSLVEKHKHLPSPSLALYSNHKDVYYTKGSTEFGRLTHVSQADSGCDHLYEVHLSHLESSICVAEVSCGKEHVLIRSQFGSIYSCGLGSRGQLGHGDVEEVTTPRLLEAMEGVQVISCQAGGWHSACVTVSGDVYTWGWDESGQLGLGSRQGGLVTEPSCVDIPGDVAVKAVACGSRHSLLLTEQGQAMATGWNGYGQLGLGHRTSQDTFVTISTLASNCVRIFAGHWCSMFVCSKG